MNKWIPITERLPERDGLYIVTFDGELAGQKEPFASTNYFENSQWDDDGDSVLAWMPLPKPYRPRDYDKPVYKMHRTRQMRGNAAAMSAG